MKKLKKKGFTLIELIVVIAILGILAMIAIPRLSGFIGTSKASSDTATMATIKTAVMTAVANNELVTPTAGTPTTVIITKGVLSGSATATSKTDGAFATVIGKYLGTPLPTPQNTSFTIYTATIDENGSVVVGES